MKTKITLVLLAAVMLIVSGIPVYAQSGGSQLFAVLENKIKPSKIFQFEDSIRKLNALKKAHQMTSWGGPVINSLNSSTYFHIFTPMEGFGDLDQMQKELTRKTDEQWNKVLDDVLATKEYEKWWIVLERQDLSYHPEGERVDITKAGYVNIVFFHGISGQESELVEVFRDWKKMYEKKEIDYGYTVFETVMGGERPLYLIVEIADNIVDYHKRDQATVKTLAEDGDALMQRSLQVCRDFKVIGGAFRPDLAYWNGFFPDN